MDTNPLGSTIAPTPTVQPLAVAGRPAQTDTGAAPAQVATLQAQDQSSATAKAAGPAPVAPAAAQTGTVSLAGFVASTGIRQGNRVDLDGPAWYNGTGTVKRLDADHLTLTISGKIGNKTIQLDRASGDVFTATVTENGKTTVSTMKATQKGNRLDFVDTKDPDNGLWLTKSGSTLNINPPGFGSVDVTKA